MKFTKERIEQLHQMISNLDIDILDIKKPLLSIGFRARQDLIEELVKMEIQDAEEEKTEPARVLANCGTCSFFSIIFTDWGRCANIDGPRFADTVQLSESCPAHNPVDETVEHQLIHKQR